MNAPKIVDDILNDYKELNWRLHDMRSTIWDFMVSVCSRYYDTIQTETDFLDVITELLDRVLRIRTGVPGLDFVVELLDGVLIKIIVTRIDRLVLDRFFGPDWFTKLRSVATDVFTSSTQHAALVDEASVMELHEQTHSQNE